MEENKNIFSVLGAVQNELNAPKTQHNKFGNYNYRSAEDICEAVKPLLAKYGAVICLSDKIEAVGERVYVVATATFVFGGETVIVSAAAREEREKKGMDAAQITGSASSYARKYALNGLLLIDDCKDPDTRDNRNGADAERPQGKPERVEPLKFGEDDIQRMVEAAIKLGMPQGTLAKAEELIGEPLTDLDATEANRKLVFAKMREAAKQIDPKWTAKK